MNFRRLFTILSTSFLVLTSCGATPTSTLKTSWTILVYISGADLESFGHYATEDIKEMLRASNQPSNVNIVIETGGASSWSSTYGISAEKLGRYHVRNNQLIKDEELTYSSMGDSETLQSFVEYGLTKYPADKTGLILWGHGAALDGVCVDEIADHDGLTSKEVTTALERAFHTAQRKDKLEFIGYDSCLMSIQDIAEFNSKYFNYMVASEESESRTGWAYDKWLGTLYKDNETETILKSICDSFVDSITDYNQRHGKDFNNQNLAFLDLSKMSNYKTKFDTFSYELSRHPNKDEFKDFVFENGYRYGDVTMNKESYNHYIELGYDPSWFTTAGEYYVLNGGYVFGVYDGYDLLEQIINSETYASLVNVANNAKEALSELIAYNYRGKDATRTHGLSYIVANGRVEYSSLYTNFNTWRNIVG